MPDLTPSRNLRLEIAWTTPPESDSPAWVDMSDRLSLKSGITIRRGRQNEYDTVQTGTMSCTLENIDGAISPDNPASPYYPNVLPQKRIRLTYRDGSTYGQRNLVTGNSASFESGAGDWLTTYFGAPAAVGLATSSSHPSSGANGMVIGWPTAAAGCAAATYSPVLTIGRRYTFRIVVWNAVGNPPVIFGDIFGVMPTATSTVTGAFETLSFSWVATQAQPILGVRSTGATTSGMFTWVDSYMVDETPTGTTLGAFTTTAPDIIYRFDGHVDEWPIAWPGGSDLYSASDITATDLLARIGERQRLRSVVAETILLDHPIAYYPLSEPEGSALVYDAAGTVGGAALVVRRLGAAGAITFAGGTGVPTDGAAAPLFAPSSSTVGYLITGRTPFLNYTLTGDCTIEAAFTTSSVTAQVVAAAFDDWGNRVTIETNSTGKVVARVYVALGAGDLAVATSAASHNTGATVHAAATLSQSAGTTTIRLVVNGIEVASASWVGAPALYCNIAIGGMPDGWLFSGVVSHVAFTPSALTAAQLLEHRTAEATGFAGERSDQRIARIARWAMIPPSRLALDVGSSTSIAHVDCTGKSPLEYMRQIEATEGGLLFVGTDGRLTFRNRARTYTASSPAVIIPANMLEAGARLVKGTQLVKNAVVGSREGGTVVRMSDAASIADFGVLSESLDLATTSDVEVADAVGWLLSLSKSPQTRFTSLDLDAFTDATYSPQILAGIGIGAHTRVTDMPAQAPASTLDQTVEGYSESITESSWVISANASIYTERLALVLDDATLGVLDSVNRIAY